MRNLIRSSFPLLVLVFSVGVSSAHFNILLPTKHSIKKDESVTLLYRWGHPFEHQLFDAAEPTRLLVIAPDGKISHLEKKLEKVKHLTPDKKAVVAFQLQFTPAQRGDYTFVLHTPPIFLEEDGEFLQDVVKVVLHVQAQKNWDGDIGNLSVTRHDGFKVLPLTRPYGLQPGMVFQAQYLIPEKTPIIGVQQAKPLAGALVEIERFNPLPPKKLPPDEHITRTAKTDPNGVVTCTLPEAGWWCLTAQADGGTRKHKGKDFPVRLRSTLWVHVDEKVGS